MEDEDSGRGAVDAVEEDEEAQNEQDEAEEAPEDKELASPEGSVGDEANGEDGAYEIDIGGNIEEEGGETPDDQESADPDDREEEEEPEHEVSALEAEIARVLDEGCNSVQLKLAQHLQTQTNRVVGCTQRVQVAIQQRRAFIAKQEQLLAQSARERDNLQAQVEALTLRLRCEEDERAEEREWIAELWPDNVPLPTLLIPVKKSIYARHAASVAAVEPVKLVKDLTNEQERGRLEALIARRVEPERVRQQLEEVSHWKLVLPENPVEGDGQVPYFINTHTGASVWDAPVAMLFEVPSGWNLVTMDWDESYGLENFYPGARRQAGQPSSKSDDEADDKDDASDASGGSGNEEDEKVDDDDVPMDPMPARERFDEEMKRYQQLKAEVEQSAARQRSLAMEVLTATRELFEREQEQLKEEDAAVIAVERKRRLAEKEEQAAAKAKAEAEQHKAQQANTGKASVVPVFARDSVAKKGLTLAADDQVFEQELRDFAVAQRVDRLYLSIPLTRDLRVRERHKLEPEFVHMKHVESRVLEAEKLEFDLLEKSALRHEEAVSKATELRELCEKIRQQQRSVEEELVTVDATILKLETAVTPPPEQPRPTQEELARAAGRYLTVDPLPSDDEEENKGDLTTEADTMRVEGATDAEERVTASEDAIPDATAAPDLGKVAASSPTATKAVEARPVPVDDARTKVDESELRELKAFTDAELAWRQWDQTEKVRSTKLNKLSDRQTLLLTSRKQLAVDLALYEDADAPFFERLRDLEKAANTRMWEVQAQTQVVRARFVVERAAREESVFQMKDRLKEMQQQLEDAYALPLQALHPLERVGLEAQSRQLVASLQSQEAELQARYAQEEEAKALLVSLELRACDYADAKLQEEIKLFAEKQALWDLSFTLADELQDCRQTIERLYLLIQEKGQEKIEDEPGIEAVPGDESQAVLSGDDAEEDPEPSPRELYEENARVFETKLQYLQQVRRFLLMCYDREDRWRALAATALTKDTTSDEWMTSMQLSRQEDSLVLLQTQHEEQQEVLQRKLKLLTKVKATLQAQVEELNGKLYRLQSDYRTASESVRLQTQVVIRALRDETEEHKAMLEKEKLRFRSDREQLIREHDVVREELENRLQQLDDVIDKQTHWLTAAKRELHAQRVANEELLKAYQSLEKRRAAEVNDMRFRISAQIKKINNVEMWNLSMKISAKEAHTDFINMQKAMAKQQQQHKHLQRGLRLLNWRHRVTAQSILTDVNLLFAFFADGIEMLAGATPEINDALRENAGIEVLAALARHSSHQSVRAICARALGQLSWNANATARSLGWKAKQKWFQWMKTQSSLVLGQLSASNTAFDAVAEEETAEMNWLADPSAPIDNISGESDHDLSSKGGKEKAKKLLFTATWQQFDNKNFPDTNVANQQYMGLSSSVLQTILDLSRSPETDKLVQRNALHSLALIVRSSRNTSIIGRMDGSIALLVGLLEPQPNTNSDEDPHVVRHAVQALANLAFRNAFNQQTIYAEGGIPLLLRLCERAVSSSDALNADVDLTLTTTQALSHLSHDHVLSCQAVVEERGISTLTRLCNSPRIHDAIDLEVYELIQTYTSQVIANVITLLDGEDSESDHRSYHIADFILEEQAQFEGYSSGVGPARKKRDHDNQQQHSVDQRTSKHAGVSTFVLMCASCNRNVAFHGAIVLGSIAQHDAIRAAIGAASGMDALFLLAARIDDLPMVAQATWALANLTWNRDNQYRVSRYIDQLHQLCTLGSGPTTSVSLNQQEGNQQLEEGVDDELTPEDPAARLERKLQDEQLMRQIREHGLCILANSLFYNDANRQLVASHAAWMQLLGRNALDADGATLENSARALCSLSYSDPIALRMGSAILADAPSRNGKAAATSMSGLHILIRLCGRAGNVAVQQHGLFGVINMCLHDANKTRMLEIPHGIDTLVNLSGHLNKELSDPALEALELLADLRQLKQNHGISSAQSFESVDMKKLIALLSDATNPSLVAMISDAIADEVWRKPSAQVRLRNEHGLEKLLEICVKPPPLFPGATSGSSPAAVAEIERRVRISCLWALRNTVANNVRNQDFVGALGGVQQLISAFDRERQSEEVVEALLAALVAVVMKHPRNSQQLVQFGLDMLISLADGTEDSNRLEEDRRSRGVVLPPLKPPDRVTAVSSSKTEPANINFASNGGEKQLENVTLARELLHLVAPYNIREVTAAPASSDAKVRRRQQLHASSTSPVHRR